ncbi:uncharacterized protein LOC142162336 [Nicotiana tabacum]|uniref:Uncharacterized protein LOC142162336 n=1 Tax=Nicotiana tabacum TaxID=4097 RepID=A0AC58RPW3_TOBAC
MADMQKRFAAAMNEVLPNAGFRMCARHKSIITMLEEIRRKIMTRQVDMLKFADTWISDISPMARLLLEDSKDLARKCTVLWNADVGFEIGEGLHKHVVNLTDKAVEHWYKRDTFLKAYKYFIQPMTNMKMWPETNNPKIEPPKPKPISGRPQRNRRKGKDEPKKKYGKLSKCGVKMTCSKCHQQGHNKRYCKAENWMPSQQGSQSSQGASQPDAAGSSSQPTNSVCFDTTRVRRVNEARSSSQPTPSSTDSSRPARRGLGSQLPPKGKATTSQKRGRGASKEDAEKGAQKGPKMLDLASTQLQVELKY